MGGVFWVSGSLMWLESSGSLLLPADAADADHTSGPACLKYFPASDLDEEPEDWPSYFLAADADADADDDADDDAE